MGFNLLQGEVLSIENCTFFSYRCLIIIYVFGSADDIAASSDDEDDDEDYDPENDEYWKKVGQSGWLGYIRLLGNIY